MERRKNRPYDGPLSRSKTYSIPENLIEAVQEEARKEGHNNGSRIVVAAIIDWLNRRRDVRAA